MGRWEVREREMDRRVDASVLCGGVGVMRVSVAGSGIDEKGG